ncbi:cytochrome c-type biogenesis protein [Modicisalibacter ilicicola DSM 19980]|uniref:Cytochrome c-type biogenesis protein n=1 Tax=Modicisalibacter ilicicola DSM 19980 TaxID=1121942 RepID=A0A1M5DMI8_9GAMM|nr:cytochrome c biogenesis protein CcdA [Halomonas ilicicola]SHF67992.1 cytochrome c-type biogenesis protein [Halomonas ilicicola DSM 19980]
MDTLSSIGLLGALAGGLLSFFSPCTLPLLPAYLSVVTGGSAGKQDKRLEAMILSMFFVLGFSVVFILLGLGASSIGQLLRGYRQELNWVTGSVVMLLGLFMTGVLRMPLFQRSFLQLTPNFQGGSPLAATAFGVSFAIGWTPCIGPILGAILMATSSAANAQAGMVYLSAYSLGMAIPFLASTLLINRFARHGRRLGKWSAYARPVAGGILILMGLAIVSGTLTQLASVLVDWFPFLATIG